MGCQCSGGSQIEQFLTDFVEELRIRGFTDKKYMEFLEKNNPFVSQDKKFQEFLNPIQKNNYEEHLAYSDMLYGHPRQYLCVALLLLTGSNVKNISSEYLTLIDRLKNKYLEVSSTKLDDLYKSDYDVMKTCLQFYCRMISYDIVEACMKVNRVKMTNDQANQLRSIYGANVIEFFVNDILRDYNTTNFNHDEFFKKFYHILHHPHVRERLRIIWTSKFAHLYQKQAAPAVKEGKIYTLNNNVEFEKPVEKPAVVSATGPSPQLVSAGFPSRDTIPVTDYSYLLNKPVHINTNDLISNPRKTIDLVSNVPPVDIRSSLGAYPTNLSYSSNPSTSLVSSQNPLFSSQPAIDFGSYLPKIDPVLKGSYIDPYNNATNQFLYGRKKIDPSEVVTLDSQKFLTLKQFRKNALDYHNEKRKLHNVPQVTEDLSLTERAQDWANQLAEKDELDYSDCKWNDKTIGENIARAAAILNDAGNAICSKWYSEIKEYDFGTHTPGNNTKNFVQMIWKDIKHVGFGIAYSNTGKTYVVVNYYPSGDLNRNLRDNVLPASY